MPSLSFLLGLLVAIFIIWVVLKLARVAIKLILFIVAIVIIAGAVLWIFTR